MKTLDKVISLSHKLNFGRIMDGSNFSPTNTNLWNRYEGMFSDLDASLSEEPPLLDLGLPHGASRTAEITARVVVPVIGAGALSAPSTHARGDRRLSVLTSGLDDLVSRPLSEMGFECPPAPRRGYDITFSHPQQLWFVVRKPEDEGELLNPVLKKVRY